VTASAMFRITSLISDEHGAEGMSRVLVRTTPDVTTLAFSTDGDDTLDVISCQTAAERRLVAAILETMCRSMRKIA
jgi:hypothetical protein